MLQHEGTFPYAALRRRSPRSARHEPGAALRLIARLRPFSLDERLAAGEDPARSALLAARAALLTGPRHRERLAAALRGLLVAVEQRPRISRVSPHGGAVTRNQAALEELARRLDSAEPLYARGLARLERLLSDATGPVFLGGTDELAAELRHVGEELGGGPAPSPSAGRARRLGRAGSVRRLARLRAVRAPSAQPDPPGFAGSSFALPDGSWFHGRRESA